MSHRYWVIGNFVALVLLFLIAAGVQSSLLYWVTGLSSSFQFTMVLIIYMCLTRKAGEALLYTVIGSYALGLGSHMLESVAVFGGACIFLGLFISKTRIYSPSPSGFLWAVVASMLGFHFITWLVSILGDATLPQGRVLDWLRDTLLTALISPAMYRSLLWFDQKTKRVEVGEIAT